METYNFMTIVSSCIYISVVSLFTTEMYKIIRTPKRMLIHLIFGILLALIGVAAMLQRDRTLLGDFYWFAPLVYLGLLQLANTWTLKLHGRSLIRANRFNMAAEETKDAKFSDYFLFIVVNFTPIVLPLLIFETILGYR